MKIKRFIALDMRQALQKVREEQGADAVILSSRNLPEGAEVVAAIDYDESLMMQSPPPVQAQPVAIEETQTLATTVPTAVAPNGQTAVVSAPAAVRLAASTPRIERTATQARPINVGDWVEQHSIDTMQRELASMRRMIEQQMSQIHEDRLRVDPIRGRLLDELISQGLEAEHARSAVACVASDKPLDRARGHVLGILAKALVTAPVEPLEAGGVIALVGPTGAGKTTTLAKLAAMYAARYSARDVALVSADRFRVGACEQLQHYGRLLGMPVIETNGRSRLQETLQRLSDYRLILVDCAGLSPGAGALAQQLSWLREQRPVSRLLVIPAHLQASDMDRMIDHFDGNNCGVILSKLDETTCLGGAISVAIRRRLSLVYVTDGQRVPEDIQRAQPHRLVLKLGNALRQATPTKVQELRHVMG